MNDFVMVTVLIVILGIGSIVFAQAGIHKSSLGVYFPSKDQKELLKKSDQAYDAWVEIREALHQARAQNAPQVTVELLTELEERYSENWRQMFDLIKSIRIANMKGDEGYKETIEKYAGKQ